MYDFNCSSPKHDDVSDISYIIPHSLQTMSVGCFSIRLNFDRDFA